jgi:hypothetical protein
MDKAVLATQQFRETEKTKELARHAWRAARRSLEEAKTATPCMPELVRARQATFDAAVTHKSQTLTEYEVLLFRRKPANYETMLARHNPTNSRWREEQSYESDSDSEYEYYFPARYFTNEYIGGIWRCVNCGVRCKQSATRKPECNCRPSNWNWEFLDVR